MIEGELQKETIREVCRTAEIGGGGKAEEPICLVRSRVLMKCNYT